jgi:glycosyltransferase involved in cell wall biosynthesis
MNLPIVSIITSTKNNAASIKEAIESVLHQTYKNWELIVINDNSSDNTAEIVEQYANNDKRIMYYKNDVNLGLTASLNDGLKKAKGEYIARLDSDDIWIDREKLADQVTFLNTHPHYGLVGSWAYTIDTQGKRISDRIYPIKDKDIRNYLLLENCFIHSSVVMRRSVVEKINGYNELFKYAQDYDLWLRIAKTSKVYNLPKFSVYYRINTKGISQTKYDEQLAETIAIVKKNRRAYKHYFPSIIFWNIRAYIPKNVREGLSRVIRKTIMHYSILQILL